MSDLPKCSGSKGIEKEAAAWFAQLDGGDLSVRDLAAFREWMTRSPLHQLEVKNLAKVWGQLNSLTDLMEPIAAAHATEKKLLSTKSQLRYRTGAKWASMVAICLVVVFSAVGRFSLNQSENLKSQPSLITTNIGQHKTSILPDGSSVTLNTNSRIEVHYGDVERKIRLLKGEAIFDVVADKNRQFTVYAGDGVVRAVGTVFSVRIDDDIVNVAVTEGAVELSNIIEVASPKTIAAPTIQLVEFVKSGHIAILENRLTLIEPVSIAQIQENLSWQDGLLTFSGEKLENVVEEVSRYTSLKISISNPEINNIRIGGVFPMDDTDAFFGALEAGFGISVLRASENEVILSLSSQQ